MRYRKKPVEIEARQFTGDNAQELLDWIAGPGPFSGKAAMLDRGGNLIIHTLEGNVKARKDDWIIRGVKGEFYPCKPDIFETTYEAVEEEL